MTPIAFLTAALVTGQATPELPADLKLVPRGAIVFLSARPAELLAGDMGKALRKMDSHMTSLPMILDAWSHGTSGVPLRESERLTLIVTDAGLVLVVRALRPLDRGRVLRRLDDPAPAKQLRGHPYHHNKAGTVGVLFVDERTFLVGTSVAVEKCVSQEPAGKGEGLLDEAVRAAANGAHLAAAFVNPSLKGGPDLAGDVRPELALLKPLLQAQAARVTFRFGKEFSMELRAALPEEGPAREAEKVLRSGRDLLLPNLPELGDVLAERFAQWGGPREAREVLQFVEAAEPGLRALAVERQGKTLTVRLRVPGRGAEWAMLVLCTPVPRTSISDSPFPDNQSPDPLPRQAP
jgi:hypothetical protein